VFSGQTVGRDAYLGWKVCEDDSRLGASTKKTEDAAVLEGWRLELERSSRPAWLPWRLQEQDVHPASSSWGGIHQVEMADALYESDFMDYVIPSELCVRDVSGSRVGWSGVLSPNMNIDVVSCGFLIMIELRLGIHVTDRLQNR
jgi:hypothetical protein